MSDSSSMNRKQSEAKENKQSQGWQIRWRGEIGGLIEG